MKHLQSLSILIPCYNDELTIEKAVKEAVMIARKIQVPFEIIVVNDASTDNSKQILSQLAKQIRQLRVISHRRNKGYGATIKELYYSGKKTWLFTIPGDYQVGANQLIKLLPHSSSSDLIIGWRTKREDSEARKRQSKIYNSLLHILFTMPVHDANSVRLMKRKVMKKIFLISTSAFVDAELVLRARKVGLRISEAHIVHRQRALGTHGGGGRISTILPTMKDMILFYLMHV